MAPTQQKCICFLLNGLEWISRVAWFRQALALQMMVVPSHRVASETSVILVISFLAHREKKQEGARVAGFMGQA